MSSEQTSANRILQLNTLAESPQREPLVVVKRRAWQGVSVERYHLVNFESPEISYSNLVVGLSLNGNLVQEVSVNGKRRQFAYTRGDMTLYPAAMPHAGRQEKNEPTDSANIYFTPAFIERLK
ncbi:AraC family ligand binding domain-containing protein [Scytonema sp. NUACC26]|uniref:AraC family ligand binding domain-containing protein n=1 Tax=Scytonema sp. NUACC26 TaxID=3140176 RepID=UPI0034DB9D6A